MKLLSRVPAPVWMCLPVLLLLALSLALLATPASAQPAAKAEAGCAAPPMVVAVVIDDGSRPLDPRDPYYAEKLAARYQALNRR